MWGIRRGVPVFDRLRRRFKSAQEALLAADAKGDAKARQDELLESTMLVQQAVNNTKEQFATSPDLQSEIMNAIIAALDAHALMSTQALNSDVVRGGIKDILLNHSQLWEALRNRAGR